MGKTIWVALLCVVLRMRSFSPAGAFQDPQEQKHDQDADSKADPLPGPRGEGEGEADVIFI